MNLANRVTRHARLTLQSYRRALRAHAPLSSEEERRALAAIARLEIDVWVRALSFAPMVDHVLDLLDATIAGRPSWTRS